MNNLERYNEQCTIEGATKWERGDILLAEFPNEAHLHDGGKFEAFMNETPDSVESGRQYRRIAERFSDKNRFLSLSWKHHYDCSTQDNPSKWLKLTEKNAWSCSQLRDSIAKANAPKQTQEEVDAVAFGPTQDKSELTELPEQEQPERFPNGYDVPEGMRYQQGIASTPIYEVSKGIPRDVYIWEDISKVVSSITELQWGAAKKRIMECDEESFNFFNEQFETCFKQWTELVKVRGEFVSETSKSSD